jgi:hypothetical protein
VQEVKMTLGGLMKKRLFVLLPLFFLACSSASLVPFEQYSAAMNLTVEADSSIFIGNGEKFTGVMWINSVLKAEQEPAKSVKLVENFGKYYLCADQFKNVWIMELQKDGMTARSKAVDVTPEDKSDVYTNTGFSRYGSKENATVHFRFNGRQVFIDRKGNVHETYK